MTGLIDVVDKEERHLTKTEMDQDIKFPDIKRRQSLIGRYERNRHRTPQVILKQVKTGNEKG